MASFKFEVCLGGALFLFRGKIFGAKRAPAEDTARQRESRPSRSRNPRIAWTLDLANSPIPAAIASGRIRGKDFSCGRAILDGGTLTLRHGDTTTTDLGLNIFLAARRPEELNGRTFNITPNNTTPPWVVLRWKEGQAGMSETFKGGYALKLEFGSIQSGRMPGKIYVCMPDGPKSRVAGTFSAEVVKATLPAPQADRSN